MHLRPWLLSSLAVAAVVTTGCAGDVHPDRPALHTVQGRITVGGKPAAGATISLQPAAGADTKALVPTAIADNDGVFRIGTFGSGDGAPEGEYVATIVWLKSQNNSEDATQVDRLSGRYASAQRSKLKVTVKPGPNDLPEFQLK